MRRCDAGGYRCTHQAAVPWGIAAPTSLARKSYRHTHQSRYRETHQTTVRPGIATPTIQESRKKVSYMSSES